MPKIKKHNNTLSVSSFSSFLSTKNGKITCIIVSIFICLVFAVISLYGPAKDYYVSLRQNDKLNAQLCTLQDVNSDLEKDISYLQTDEGVRQRAIENLGLVNQGEQVGSVSGLNEQTDKNTSTNNTSSRLAYKTIKAPKTWYSDFCDVLFGVNTSA